MKFGKPSFLVFFLCLISCVSKQALEEDEAELQRFLSSKQEEINACFDQNSQNLQSQSRIHLSAEHLRDGSFGNLRIQSGETSVGICVMNKLKTWKTKPPRISGPVELSWTYDREIKTEIATTDLSRFQDDFDTCFQKAQAEDPGIWGGILRVQVRVNQSGKVEELEELSGFKGSRLIIQCLSEAAEGWSFSKKESPSTQVWTWNFKKNL